MVWDSVATSVTWEAGLEAREGPQVVRCRQESQVWLWQLCSASGEGEKDRESHLSWTVFVAVLAATQAAASLCLRPCSPGGGSLSLREGWAPSAVALGRSPREGDAGLPAERPGSKAIRLVPRAGC